MNIYEFWKAVLKQDEQETIFIRMRGFVGIVPMNYLRLMNILLRIANIREIGMGS